MAEFRSGVPDPGRAADVLDNGAETTEEDPMAEQRHSSSGGRVVVHRPEIMWLAGSVVTTCGAGTPLRRRGATTITVTCALGGSEVEPETDSAEPDTVRRSFNIAVGTSW
jgi:hypothetical protein